MLPFSFQDDGVDHSIRLPKLRKEQEIPDPAVRIVLILDGMKWVEAGYGEHG